MEDQPAGVIILPRMFHVPSGCDPQEDAFLLLRLVATANVPVGAAYGPARRWLADRTAM